MNPTAPIISLRDASVRRGTTTIWSRGTFDIAPGTVTAIVGTNGTGKTTLLGVELGLIPLSGGEARVLGGRPGSHNDRIGYVPQSYVAQVDANITAEQSVLLGLTGTRFGFHRVTAAERAAVTRALEDAGIADHARYRLSDLSGGMRQRVAIARALVCEPKLLLLDEPLANLDIASQRSIVDVLGRLNRDYGMTIQIVSHDINMLLPILTGAIYLLDGHPHYSPIDTVMDSDLLTHLYGTRVEVVTTPQGDMFVRPGAHAHDHGRPPHTHTAEQAARFHQGRANAAAERREEDAEVRRDGTRGNGHGKEGN